MTLRFFFCQISTRFLLCICYNNSKKVINKIYFLELEKERKVLEEMIEKEYSKEEILKQSRKVDKLLSKYMKELYNL